MARGKTWSGDEDKTLCQAWVHVSEDSIKGSDQSKESFWQQVHKEFCNSVGSDIRSVDSIKCRWKDINMEVSRFVGIVSNLKQKNESGKTDEDLIIDAEAVYFSIAKKKFLFMSAYSVLSKRPKWKVISTHTPSKLRSEDKENTRTDNSSIEEQNSEILSIDDALSPPLTNRKILYDTQHILTIP